MSTHTVRLHVAAELRPLLFARRRGAAADVPHDGTSSLGHLVQSVGVPLTEVGRLEVNGRPETPAYRPHASDMVNVLPVRRPQAAPTDPPRFLLDVHLGALARRLRLLGLDTAYRNDASDDDLVAHALAERRVLLTQDRGILRRRSARHGAYVRGSEPDEQLRDVVDRFRPALHPFSRCPTCNGLINRVAKHDVLDVLEPGTRRTYEDFRRCDSCGRVYWRGAHARRLDRLIASVTPAEEGTRSARR